VSAVILNGKAMAETLQAEAAEKAAEWKARHGSQPTLAAVLVGEDPASQVYVRNKERACAKAGLGSRLIRLPASTSEQELLKLVGDLNRDPGVHGILVQLPLPAAINSQRVLDAVAPLKDVDAFHPENVGLLVQGRPRFLPCTPHGVQQLLIRSGIETAGRHAVVVGRSEIVGKPMANMLVQRGPGGDATVTVCHSRSADLPAITRQADLLIVAIGKAKFVTGEMVKPGATVIDVGINRTETGLVGDVDFDSVKEIAHAITPVPGGVGPLTIAMLLHNTIKAADLQSTAN
jgi:methylenetetrahydrofolate dehydrogenase (NADP+)/methenyltetrahydrofolate cyclohydrolase